MNTLTARNRSARLNLANAGGRFLCAALCAAATLSPGIAGVAQEVFIRASQVGYASRDMKLAIAFSREPLPDKFAVVRSSNPNEPVFTGTARVESKAPWGQFSHHREIDFSSFRTPGKYCLRVGGVVSLPFEIAENPFRQLPDWLLEFMRQQRCGYNPWLDAKCHQFDGRTAFGPLPDATQIDAVGGWHDAGDQLKYLLTSGNATAQMLLAYELSGKAAWLSNAVDASGRTGPNDLPDLLDEARWGLEWMLKLHPAPDQLYHQVADDRDHAGRRLPQNEFVDYGWGKGGARVVYFADGKPQGLQKYKSESTGVANLAGRHAAAMALAYQIWHDDPAYREFAERCLKTGKEVYAMGRAKEGSQQGNSYRAPYRYEETTWADDMEWGAAELFRATRSPEYLEHAKRYAHLARSDTWMGLVQPRHYQFYPYVNVGHYRLYDLVERDFQKVLAQYYREGLDRCLLTAGENPYGAGVPFIWCSNNLLVGLVTQCLLYERMTGDARYQEFAAKNRDWLLGRNPWGYSMFTEIGTVYPKDVHLPTALLTKRSIRGGLVDGPVYDRIFRSLKGVAITQPDPLAAFQGPAVFHDDYQDYSSNEPTMDGTASAILLWAICGARN
jgi:hypothetical protein